EVGLERLRAWAGQAHVGIEPQARDIERPDAPAGGAGTVGIGGGKRPAERIFPAGMPEQDQELAAARRRRGSDVRHLGTGGRFLVGFDHGAHGREQQVLHPGRGPGRYPVSRAGSQSESAGKATRSATRKSSAKKKGITPRKVSRMGTSGASELMTNTFIPTGGVISPSSTTTSARMPNQTFRSSVGIPKSSAETTGQKKGIASRSIDRLSIRQPSAISATSSRRRITVGESPDVASISAAACGTPPRDMKILSSSAPSRMRKIIPLVAAVSYRVSRSWGSPMRRRYSPNARTRVTPIAAAGVGLKKPK